MENIFGANIYKDREADQNVMQMNSLFMNLVSTSSMCDCQSHPLKDYFGDFYLKARFSIENTYDKLLSATPIELYPNKGFMRVVEQRPYTDTIQFRAEVPEGMNVTYLEYLEVLIPAQLRANQILTDVISPFSKFVAKMISDEMFRNQTIHQIKEFHNLEGEYNKIVKGFAKCFGKNDYRANAAFGEVVRRTGDWQTVFAQTGVLRQYYQEFPNKKLTAELNSLYEMLDKLIEQIKVDGYAQVVKEVTQLLSLGMYSIAREVEMAALTTFRSKVFIEAINTTIKNIEKLHDK